MMEATDRNPMGPAGPELLGQLLDRHGAALELYARQLCECAEDCVQEALVELARRPTVPDDVIELLPREQREVLVSHLWGGLTFQQVARLTGTSDSTAHRRYEAALSVLREKLGVSCPKTK